MFFKTVGRAELRECPEAEADWVDLQTYQAVVRKLRHIEEPTMRAATYSGPRRSGTCVCGHLWTDHHLGCVVNPAMVMTTGGPENYILQECEFFGCNEDGGLDAEGNDHCFGYRDSSLLDEHN